MKYWASLMVVCSVALVVTGFIPRDNGDYSPGFEIISEPDTLRIENPSFVYPQFLDVTVTVYHAVEGQCDDTPDILADGTRIDVRKAGSYRFCALSRDLLSRWDGPYAYGDTVYVENAGHLSGPWIVRDTMHPRWKNRVDLLVDVDTRPYKFEYAKLRSL